MEKELTSRNNNPKSIQQHKIPVKIISFGSRILNPIYQIVKRTRAIVQYIPVKLPSRDDYLQRVSERIVRSDERGEEERQWTPAPGCNGLHGHDKGVRSEIPRIRHGVFFPELGEEVLGARKGSEVQGIVAFKEEVDGAT